MGRTFNYISTRRNTARRSFIVVSYKKGPAIIDRIEVLRREQIDTIRAIEAFGAIMLETYCEKLKDEEKRD